MYVAVHDLVIARAGRRLLSVDRVRVDYSISELIGGKLHFSLISLDHLVMQAGAIPVLLPERKPRAVSGRAFTLNRVRIDRGEIIIGPAPAQVGGVRVPDVIRDLNAELSVEAAPGRTVVDVHRLSFVGESPAVTVKRFAGVVTIADGDLVLDRISMQLAESSLTFSARIENFRHLGQSHDED